MVHLAKIPIADRLSIRECGFDEYWLQDQIFENPDYLDLGDLEVVAKKKHQLSGGKLDLLMKNPEDVTMYEVEIMLGETDEITLHCANARRENHVWNFWWLLMVGATTLLDNEGIPFTQQKKRLILTVDFSCILTRSIPRSHCHPFAIVAYIVQRENM